MVKTCYSHHLNNRLHIIQEFLLYLEFPRRLQHFLPRRPLDQQLMWTRTLLFKCELCCSPAFRHPLFFSLASANSKSSSRLFRLRSLLLRPRSCNHLLRLFFLFMIRFHCIFLPIFSQLDGHYESTNSFAFLLCLRKDLLLFRCFICSICFLSA